MDCNVPGREEVALRIIDANINRCAEGLRVIEEVARFSREDRQLMRDLKELRHQVRALSAIMSIDVTGHRDSGSDVGRAFSTDSEKMRGSIEGTVTANFKRVQEGLRVIEEFAKHICQEGSLRAKELRFRTYQLEKSFESVPTASRPLPDPPFLYTFLDRALVDSDRISEVAGALIEGGSGMIQYRAKNLPLSEMRHDLATILPLTDEAGIPLIVNDYPELAAETGADGVHLGRSDQPPREARSIMGPSRIVGMSVRSPDDLAAADMGDLDYVAVGSMFPTVTKADAIVSGLSALESVKKSTDLAVVAIGGITPDNARLVLDAGADGLAVISAVLEGDPLKNCFTFSGIIDRRRGGKDGA